MKWSLTGEVTYHVVVDYWLVIENIMSKPTAAEASVEIIRMNYVKLSCKNWDSKIGQLSLRGTWSYFDELAIENARWVWTNIFLKVVEREREDPEKNLLLWGIP